MRVTVAAFALVACVSASASTSAAAQRTDSWAMAMHFTIDSGAGATPVVMTMRQLSAGAKMRMEVSMAGMPDEVAGTYMVYNGADTTMTTVMPAQHSAMIMPLDLAANMRPQRMTVRATESDLADLGPGEAILGHATHRYRIASSGALEITINGQTCTQKYEGVSELWWATDVDLESARSAQLKSMAAFAPMETVTEMYGSARSRLPKGSALRTIATTKSFDAAGNAREVKTTLEITELAHGTVPDSALGVPAGYRTMNMRDLMKQLPAGMMDSVMKATREKGSETACRSFGGK